MRIVQVVHGFPPESLGGTETYVFQLASALAQRGHEVMVFARIADPTRTEYAVDTVARDGFVVTRINNTFRHLDTFAQSYANAAVAQRFRTFLDVNRPDVVHFHHLLHLSTTCIQEVARRGIPVVMTLHDYWLICQRGRFLKPDLSQCPGQTDEGCAHCFAQLLNRKLAPAYQRLKPLFSRQARLKDVLRRFYGRYVAARTPTPEALEQIRQRMAHVREICQVVTLFLAPSRFLREQFLHFGIPPEKIIFTACGLPSLEIKGGDARQKTAPLTFGYIGVVDPVKGVHLLVEAFQPLTGAELRIYGGEAGYAPYPDRGRFLAQVRTSPHIHMMGRYDHRELGRILSEVDVVVVPSIWYENAPLVIREAFLAGKPVVTAAFGGMREWVEDEVNGLLFRQRDVEDLRQKLARFIADPALVEKLSSQCPAVKSIEEDAREMEERYRALVRTAACRRP